MITIINKKDKTAEQKSSLCITYPRMVNIIFGHYPYPEFIHNLILEIKHNLDPNLQNYTNVKGGMTSWKFFKDKPSFAKFLAYVINKHQLTHPELFQHFFSKNIIHDAWGNEIKKGDSVSQHTHDTHNGILYLTKGCDLILPELNIKITPQPGDYYIFPPNILHGFDASPDEEKRYSLVFNIARDSSSIFRLKKEMNERENS